MSPAASGSRCIRRTPEDPDLLLRHADVAMYAAKESGVGFEVYDEIIDRYKPELLTLVTQVRPAIEDDQFRMYLQPKVRLSRRSRRRRRGADPLGASDARPTRLPPTSSRWSRRPCS